MVAILLAAAIIDPGRLEVTVRVLAEPGVLIGWRKRDRVKAVDRIAVGDPLLTVEISPVTALSLARVTRARCRCYASTRRVTLHSTHRGA